MGSTLCLGCRHYTKVFDDGTTREQRCELNGAQSGTFMEVFAEGDCDNYGRPRVQYDDDRYPLRRDDAKGINTKSADYDGKQQETLTWKEQMRDQPLYTRPHKGYHKKRKPQ